MSQDPGTDLTGWPAVMAGQVHRTLTTLRNVLAAYSGDALLWGAVCAIDAARILLWERADSATLDPAALLASDPPWPGQGSLAEAVSAARASVLAAAMAARTVQHSGPATPSVSAARIARQLPCDTSCHP
jgi:hypothetical protein